MKLEPVKGTPFDYSDDKITVYFEVADKQSTREIIENTTFIDGIEDLEHGFEVRIAMQQIPELIRHLSRENIAIYAVTPQKQ
ncbi:hypothetical protein J7W08_07190 [Methanococcoides orientis]|uniref:hypothetical protein n=1 Tax=Methanococcoides orientis TaxID=2822137 RepID=UPI001E469E2F|nr:hypothetical protein [Methanococcoides orientis]UGV39906.1 hypothetical protein J7W08_07190 [Methanococcoides orientis]